MKKVLTLLVLLQAYVLWAETPKQLSITLTSERHEYVLGEPILLQCMFENQGDTPLIVSCDLSFRETPCAIHATGPIRKDCSERPGYHEIGGYSAPPPLKAHDSMKLAPIAISSLGAVDVGEYEFWVAYDAIELGAQPLRALITPLRAESNHLKLTLVRPTGTDATVLAKCANKCNQMDWDNRALFDKYATCIYAGYALLPGGQCIPDPRVFITDILSMDKHAAKSPESGVQMAADKERSLQVTRKRVDQLSFYLKARPDFARANCLKVELAGRLAALQQFQEAQVLCNEITTATPESEEAKKAKLLLDFLAEKGCIKSAASLPAESPAKKVTTGN